MALINCEYHNQENVVFTSPYISDCVLNDLEVLENIFCVKLYIEVLDEWAHFWADSKFLLKHKLAIPEEDRSTIIIDKNFNEEEAFDIYSSTIPICKKCYTDFLSLRKIPPC